MSLKSSAKKQLKAEEQLKLDSYVNNVNYDGSNTQYRSYEDPEFEGYDNSIACDDSYYW